MTAQSAPTFIDSFCGVFKSKPGEISAVQELLEDRAAERKHALRETVRRKAKG